VQSPEQVVSVSPLVSPKRPAGHKPLQLAVGREVALPNLPAEHRLHTPAPPKLYCPALHAAAVALVLPVGQAYPAVHVPLQEGYVRDVDAPHLPGLHQMHPVTRKEPMGHDDGKLLNALPVKARNLSQFGYHEPLVTYRSIRCTSTCSHYLLQPVCQYTIDGKTIVMFPTVPWTISFHVSPDQVPSQRPTVTVEPSLTEEHPDQISPTGSCR
jgi:hypothetical protein